MRWNRETYTAYLGGDPWDGPPMFVEMFGPLVGLEQEWRDQGASDDELSLLAFDWDYVERVHVPVDAGPRTGRPECVLSDGPEEKVYLDTLGRRMRLPKRTATIALPETHPMSGPADWDRVRDWFAWDASRIDHPAVSRLKEAQENGAVVRGYIPGVYSTLRDLMGDENACLAFLDDPDWVAEILRVIGDLAVRLHEEVARHVTLDELFVHEDFAGKSGPLVGPAQVREFFAPYYRRVWSIWEARGTRIFDIDSDGDLMPVLDALVDTGITCIHPCEPAAGMDIVAIRRRYGRRLSVRGGLDKFVLAKGTVAIRRELESKMLPEMRTGGVMFGIDHRIPNGTPLYGYREYVRIGREILGLPPATRGGWARMA